MPLIIELLWFTGRLLSTTLCASLVRGLAGAAQVTLAHRALDRNAAKLAAHAFQFAAFSVLVLIARWVSQVHFVRAGQWHLARRHRDISHGLAHPEYRRLEELGAARILSVLTHDVTPLPAG